jgi:hypothetical protein
MMFKPLAAICAASAILIGCGNAGNIVGTWNDPSLGETFVANADGSYSRISQKGNHVMTIVGHYTFKGSTLEMPTPPKSSITSKPPWPQASTSPSRPTWSSPPPTA